MRIRFPAYTPDFADPFQAPPNAARLAARRGRSNDGITNIFEALQKSLIPPPGERSSGSALALLVIELPKTRPAGSSRPDRTRRAGGQCRRRRPPCQSPMHPGDLVHTTVREGRSGTLPPAHEGHLPWRARPVHRQQPACDARPSSSSPAVEVHMHSPQPEARRLSQVGDLGHGQHRQQLADLPFEHRISDEAAHEVSRAALFGEALPPQRPERALHRSHLVCERVELRKGLFLIGAQLAVQRADRRQTPRDRANSPENVRSFTSLPSCSIQAGVSKVTFTRCLAGSPGSARIWRLR